MLGSVGSQVYSDSGQGQPLLSLLIPFSHCLCCGSLPTEACPRRYANPSCRHGQKHLHINKDTLTVNASCTFQPTRTNIPHPFGPETTPSDQSRGPDRRLSGGDDLYKLLVLSVGPSVWKDVDVADWMERASSVDQWRIREKVPHSSSCPFSDHDEPELLDKDLCIRSVDRRIEIAEMNSGSSMHPSFSPSYFDLPVSRRTPALQLFSPPICPHNESSMVYSVKQYRQLVLPR